MTKSKGKLVAAAAGVGVVVLALAFWRDIAVHYHVYLLRTDREYLTEVLQTSQESTRYEAIQKFLDTEGGQQQFLDIYLRAFESDPGSTVRPRIIDDEFRRGMFGVVGESFFTFFPYRDGTEYRSGPCSGYKAVLTDLMPFANTLDENTFTSKRYPDAQFTFLRADKAARMFRGGLPAELLWRMRGAWGSSVFRRKYGSRLQRITQRDIEILSHGIALLVEPTSESP